MNHPELPTWVRSVAIATIITALMLAVLIVAAEEVPALKDWLKATFYHHWLGKGALALGVFAVVSVALSKQRSATRLSTVIFFEAIAVCVSVGIIAGFFLLHLLKLV
ncbi:hypothetical protein A2680_04160 [Candidatus Kaiserbacteria bacterium RIFCSPHIGHO2_01_FULL_55_37]|nr:MAG: hypothetical protein A2680_04160 [Candidatus Kaiserbacteria bacterium RIFCSPHIGHO2_01_FULL_55_37]